MTIEAKVLDAISRTMTCGRCPAPCQTREKSSRANCVYQWSKLLSKINPNCNWNEVRLQVGNKESNLNSNDQLLY